MTVNEAVEYVLRVHQETGKTLQDTLETIQLPLNINDTVCVYATVFEKVCGDHTYRFNNIMCKNLCGKTADDAATKVRALINQYDGFLRAGIITDADTILADIMAEASEEGYEITGLGRELLSEWLRTPDKHTFELLFENLTGCDFSDYLKRVSDAQNKTERREIHGEYSGSDVGS